MIFQRNKVITTRPVSIVAEVDARLRVIGSDGSVMLVEAVVLPAGFVFELHYPPGTMTPTAYVNLRPGALVAKN